MHKYFNLERIPQHQHDYIQTHIMEITIHVFERSFLNSKGGRDPWMNTYIPCCLNLEKLMVKSLEFDS